MPGIRGCLSAMLKVVGNVGVLLSYIAGTYLNWRQSALLVAIAPSMLFLGTFFIPETPSYLVLNGKDDEAAKSLQWLRGDQVDIRHELQVISKILRLMNTSFMRSAYLLVVQQIVLHRNQTTIQRNFARVSSLFSSDSSRYYKLRLPDCCR